MRRILNLTTITILLVALACSTCLPAVAQDSTPTSGSLQTVALGVFPQGGQDGDRFEVSIEPGQSAEMPAVLLNGGPSALRLQTFVSHLIPVPNGGLQIPESGTEPEGTVSWIDYPTEEITLEPGESVERIIKINVPEGTPPGQYVNAVALETLDPVTDPGSPFEQYFRKVVSIYVTVPGEVVVDFSIGAPELAVVGGEASITFPVENTGNTRVDLTGNVTLSDSAGKPIYEGSVLLGPIYMGQATMFQVYLPVAPAPGDGYTISYEVVDNTSAVSQSNEILAVSVPEDTGAGTDDPLTFQNVNIEANADPIVFANVSVDISSTQQALQSTKLTMSVFHNGEFVEDFVLAENLSLEIGTTTVSQRYIPAADWETGSYTFSLTLESTASGETSLLMEEEDIATLEVP